MDKKVWEADNTKIKEPLFEETRRCLLNSYHTYVQNHVGYMIAMVIGFMALVSSYDDFFKNNNCIFFWLLIIAIVVGSIYDFLRIKYWTSLANTAIAISQNKAVQFFNESNLNSYFEEAPYTAILQIAIIHRLQMVADDKTQKWLGRKILKLALKTAGS